MSAATKTYDGYFSFGQLCSILPLSAQPEFTEGVWKFCFRLGTTCSTHPAALPTSCAPAPAVAMERCSSRHCRYPCGTTVLGRSIGIYFRLYGSVLPRAIPWGILGALEGERRPATPCPHHHWSACVRANCGDAA